MTSSDVYAISEIVGSSTDSLEDDGSVGPYQVALKLGFKMED